MDLALEIEQANAGSSAHDDAWRAFTACRRTDEVNALAGQLGIH